MKIVDWLADRFVTPGGLIGFGLGNGLAVIIPAPLSTAQGALYSTAALGSMMFWGCLGLGLLGRGHG